LNIAIIIISLVLLLFMFFINRRLHKSIGTLESDARDVEKNLATLQENITEMVDSLRQGNILYYLEDARLEGTYSDILQSVNLVRREYVDCIDLMTEPFIVLSADLKIWFVNPVMQKYTRIEGREVRGLHADEILNYEISKHPHTVRAAQEKTPQMGGEIQAWLNPDQCFDLTYSCIPSVNDGKITAYILVFTNVTHSMEMQRLTEKRVEYRSYRTEKLTDNIINAFDKGNLSISITKSEFDSNTETIAREQDSVEAVVMKATETIKSYVDEITSILREIAGNNFDVSINREFIGDFGSIKDSIGLIVDSVSSLITEIQGASAGVGIGSEQIAQSTQKLLSGFEEQAVSMQEVSDAVYKLAEKTKKNSDDAQEANTLSGQVKKAAVSSSQNMEIMTTAMNDIKTSSEEISKVVGVIESIAFQTNLLALNASVEAARAGEHGKGFAVVAEEVRSLASRSAQAARETAEKLNKSLSSVESGVTGTKQTTGDLLSIVEITSSVADAIANITESSKEQSEEIRRIQNRMEALSRGAADNSGLVQGAVAVSQELSAQAGELSLLIERFRVKKKTP